MTELIPPPSTSGKSLMERLEDALLPLINLVFLMLIFFIVAGQISDTPLPDLPPVTANADQQQPYADLVVGTDGTWQIAGKTVNKDDLLVKLGKKSGEEPLRVAAADTITMSDLETLFRILEQGGYQDILLLTEPSS